MIKKQTTICFIGTLILAGGCIVGPDFQKPCPPPMPMRFVAEPNPAEIDDDLSDWWTKFNDPVLDDLIHQSVAMNLDLREAYFRIMEARAQRQIVSGELFPQVNGTGGYAYRRISINGRPFSTGNLQPRFDFFSTGFDSVWQIDVFGKVRRSIEAADAEAELSEELHRDILVILLSDVASNYVSARVLQKQIEIAEANLASQNKTLELVDRRHKTGVGRELDVAQARTNVHTTAATIPELQQNLQIALNRQSILLGESPSQDMAARIATGPIPVGPSELGAGVPANLLRRRPDIRAVEREVATESALIGVAFADYFPQFALSGLITVNSRNLSNLFSTMSLAHSVGPSVSWNLLNFGRVRNNVAAQRARHDQALVRYQNTVLLAAEEVENALVSFHRQQERVLHLEQAASAARDAARISEATYEKGLVQFQSVLDAQREVLQLEDKLADGTGEVSLQLIRVYKALGGGWDAPFAAMPYCEPWPRTESPESYELLPAYEEQKEVQASAPPENPNETETSEEGIVFEMPPYARIARRMTNEAEVIEIDAPLPVKISRRVPNEAIKIEIETPLPAKSSRRVSDEGTENKTPTRLKSSRRVSYEAIESETPANLKSSRRVL